ncbi:MAG: VWA domain-containing protein [Phycisphaerales bacterium]|nr:VWA domain-containing protein [Phycisphaerales bacterium]
MDRSPARLKRNRRTRKPQRSRAVPWMASILLHALVIAAGLVVTWTVVQEDSRPLPRPIVADFKATAFMPVDELPVTQIQDSIEPTLEPPPPIPVKTTSPEQVDMTWAVIDASMAARAGESKHDAGFAGARATNARSIVYVIDASGSMTTWLTMVLKALDQSLSRLDSAQRYAVVFFQGDQAIVVPPDRLQPARSRNIRNTMNWTRKGSNLMPGGGSNPLPALEVALQMQPDVIFMLSEGLEGPGSDTMNGTSMLQKLDELNPIADPVTGNRWTRIQCIRIGSDAGSADAESSLMKNIAERHGGSGGWVSLSRSDLMNDSGEDQ